MRCQEESADQIVMLCLRLDGFSQESLEQEAWTFISRAGANHSGKLDCPTVMVQHRVRFPVQGVMMRVADSVMAQLYEDLGE